MGVDISFVEVSNITSYTEVLSCYMKGEWSESDRWQKDPKGCLLKAFYTPIFFRIVTPTLQLYSLDGSRGERTENVKKGRFRRR